MLLRMNIEQQPVIQRGNLTIDPQCCTVRLAGEEISLYPKEFDVLCLLT
jgi:DNA-binding response OmpR family regulator